jgi:L-asparaginase
MFTFVKLKSLIGIMSIMVLITGGTFDKEYDELNGSLYFKETHLPEMLKLGRCTVPASTNTLMMIDSLEMSEADRDLILEYCKNCAEDRIVITHGTDTMEKTARRLGEAGIPKTIVLTGAMIPISLEAPMDSSILEVPLPLFNRCPREYTWP